MKISHVDVDRIVNEAFETDKYAFLAYEAIHANGLTFKVRPIGLDRVDRQILNEWKAGVAGANVHHMANILLDDACERGFIEAGEYEVSIS